MTTNTERRAIISASLMILGVIFLLSASHFGSVVYAVLAFACGLASYTFWKMTYVKR